MGANLTCIFRVVLIFPLFPEAIVIDGSRVRDIGLWETCKNYRVPGNGMVTPLCTSRASLTHGNTEARIRQHTRPKLESSYWVNLGLEPDSVASKSSFFQLCCTMSQVAATGPHLAQVSFQLSDTTENKRKKEQKALLPYVRMFQAWDRQLFTRPQAYDSQCARKPLGLPPLRR